MSTYTRMMIVEAISEKQAQDVRNHMDAHAADLHSAAAGFISSQRLSEVDGCMVVFEVNFRTMADATSYSASRHYRYLVNTINHLVVGDPVIKHFARFTMDETE